MEVREVHLATRLYEKNVTFLNTGHLAPSKMSGCSDGAQSTLGQAESGFRRCQKLEPGVQKAI